MRAREIMRRHHRAEENQGSIRCPECRKVTNIPPEGLPTNYTVLRTCGTTFYMVLQISFSVSSVFERRNNKPIRNPRRIQFSAFLAKNAVTLFDLSFTSSVRIAIPRLVINIGRMCCRRVSVPTALLFRTKSTMFLSSQR